MDVDMRPEVVSQLLSTVEAKWTQEAMNVLSNHTDESIALGAMENSCVKVSSAVVQGSDGDRLHVIEYMKTVCNEPNAKANIEMCTNFGNAIQEFMIGDNVYNREELDMHDFCHKFWKAYVMPAGQVAKKQLDIEEEHILVEQKKREEEEVAERKKLAEAAAIKKHLQEVAQNHSALNIAARWNAVQKENQKAPEVTVATPSAFTVATPSASGASSNASAPTSSAQNKTESIKNTTSQTGVQNSTKPSKSLMVHYVSVSQNATDQDAQNASVRSASYQKNLTLNVDTVGNSTQPDKSTTKNTTKLMLKNTTFAKHDLYDDVLQEQSLNATTPPSKLTDKVVKQLKFVLNRTKHSRTVMNSTNKSTNITA
jgi:hypothetical protein